MIRTATAKVMWESKARTLALFLLAVSVAALLLAGKPAPAIDLSGLYTVNSTGDQPDASAGDNSCATSGGVCTLRAAIQEANATTTGSDFIGFNIPSTDPNCNAD